MPYDNAYNRHIANEVNTINERFATLYAYSPVDGRGGYSEGGSNAGVLFQTGNASKRDADNNVVNDNLHLPEVYFHGNDAEGLSREGLQVGGNGYAKGSYRDTGEGSQLGVSASGHFNKNAELTGFGMLGTVGGGMSGGMDGYGMSGGNILGDIGSVALHLAPFLLGLGKEHPRNLGKLFAEKMEGGGVCGGSFWNDFISGVGDVTKVVAPFAPLIVKAITGMGQAEIAPVEGAGIMDMIKQGADLADKGLKHSIGILKDMKTNPEEGKKKLEKIANTNIGDLVGMIQKRGRGRPKKGCGVTGGAILGNHDPYPVQGNSARKAGRGKSGGSMNSNGDMLSMPSPELSNGVPPKAQLRGAYGGAHSDDKIIKAVEKKLGGKKLLPGVVRKMPEGMEGSGRSKRNEIVKKIMKEKGMKMIEASKYVKEHGLYKK